MIHSLVRFNRFTKGFEEFKKVMVLLEKAGKDKDSRLAGSLTK